MLDGNSYKLVTSPNTKRWLKPESLSTLCNLRLNSTKQSDIIQLHFPTEDIISVSHLKRTQDQYGRVGHINHTILIRITDYLTTHPPLSLVKDQLDKTDSTVKLETLNIKT